MQKELDLALGILGTKTVTEASCAAGSVASQQETGGIAPQVKIYRKTGLGIAVERAMEKMAMDERLREKIWTQFDHVMAGTMSRNSPTMHFKASNMSVEKEVDFVTTMHVFNAEMNFLSLKGFGGQIQGVKSMRIEAHPMPKQVQKRGPYMKTKKRRQENAD